MRTTCSAPCGETLRLFALSSVAVLACSSCGTHSLSGHTTDGSPSPDVAPLPMTDLAGEPANDTAAPDLRPRCYSEWVPLSPVGPDTPCSFVVLEPRECIIIFLNRRYLNLGDPNYGYTYDVTTSTILLAGASCDAVTSSPQDSVVEMGCICPPPPLP